MKIATFWGSVFLLGGAIALSARADQIALWNSTGSDPVAGNYAPQSQDANVAISNLVAGAALLRSGSPAANTFAAAGYSATSSNLAMSAGHYWETSIRANPGYALLFDAIQYRMRRSGSGPPTSQWAYSTNGSTYVWLQPSNAVVDSYTNDKSVPLTDIAALQNATNRIWFRLYAWSGAAGNTAWGVFGRENVLSFTGTVLSLTGVPIVTFNPASGVSVHVSNALNVAVSAKPVGSGIHQWSVAPAPVGTTSLVGGTFQFTPAAADEDGVFVLSVVATNAYGTSTGTLAIAVTEYLPSGSLEITFDNAGEVKTSYEPGAVTLSGQVWIMDQARIGDADLDVKLGARAARFGSFYEASMTSSNAILPAGLGQISFLYAQYAGGDAGAELVVEVATNAASGPWLEVGRVDANGVTELTRYATTVGLNQAMVVRIRTAYVSGVGQVNVDNIIITPYAAPTYTAYEQYLLQYNVTPGDVGTAPGEDWDGDNVSNSNEFMALPQTNPYDPASKP